MKASYKIGQGATSDEGELSAAFDGYHGWFWRNRDEQTVTLRLETTGDYIQIVQLL